MTPHLRSRQVSPRHRHVPLPLLIWCLGGILQVPLPAAPVPADRPAAFPAWWFEREVIPRKNPAVAAPLWLSGDYPAGDDYAPVNLGQVKAMVKGAVDDLNSKLPNVTDVDGVSDGAGRALNDLVAQWPPAPALPNDNVAANLGQLKAVTALVYDRLISAGHYTAYPWVESPGVNNYATANLGQLKNFFSFDITGQTHDLWAGVPGTDISSIPLTSTTTSTTTKKTGFESLDLGDNYGERICLYLTVPLSGVYRFWLTASGTAQLYISNDEDPVNAFLRAEVKSPTSPRGWTETAAGKSPLLWLEKGRPYYVEVRHKAGTGTDHVSVGWLKPSDPENPDPMSVTTPTEVVPDYALSRRLGSPAPAFTPPPALGWSDPGGSDPDSCLNRNAATRFLIQATFGPSGWGSEATYGFEGGWTKTATDTSAPTLAAPGAIPYDVAQVQSQGFGTWIDNQMNETLFPPSKLYPYVHANHNWGYDVSGNHYWHTGFYRAWWRAAITSRDQLRQRTAFALSQIMVVSSPALNPQSDACSAYYDALITHAFTDDFRKLLKAVTLEPAMGLYLDMLRNDKPQKANPTTGDGARAPNENYARELLQLFSIGMNRLNPDGTLLRNTAGQPIPTYDQHVVEGLAHVFTGWDWHYYDTVPPGPPPGAFGSHPWYNASDPTLKDIKRRSLPMREVPARHYTGQKRVLNNVVLPGLPVSAGVPLDPYGTPSPAQLADPAFQALPVVELDAVIDAIVAHPNCGPFICRQLIQRLVTSHPRDAYVYRVTSVFNDDGSTAHKRGNMAAVIRAILMDHDARSSSMLSIDSFGKQREPVCRMTALARAFPSLENTGWVSDWKMPQTSFVSAAEQPDLNQTPLGAPSVFNFYRPDYQFPGDLADEGLTTPEFQLTTATSVIAQANVVNSAFLNWNNPGAGRYSVPGGARAICMDMNHWTPPTVDNSYLAGIIDNLSLRLMGGQLPVSGTNSYYPTRVITNPKQAIIDAIATKGVAAVSAATSPAAAPVTITTAVPHCLSSGDKVFFNFNIGGNFSAPLYVGHPTICHAITVTGANTFTIPVTRLDNSAVYLTGATISLLAYDSPASRLTHLVNLVVNSPDFIIQR